MIESQQPSSMRDRNSHIGRYFHFVLRYPFRHISLCFTILHFFRPHLIIRAPLSPAGTARTTWSGRPPPSSALRRPQAAPGRSVLALPQQFFHDGIFTAIPPASASDLMCAVPHINTCMHACIQTYRHANIHPVCPTCKCPPPVLTPITALPARERNTLVSRTRIVWWITFV